MKKKLLTIINILVVSTILFVPATVLAEDPIASPSPSPSTSPSPSPATESNDCYLKSLAISGYNLNETFSMTKYSYTLSVPASLTKVTVSALVNDTTATISSGTGTIPLNASGDTAIRVIVKAEDDSTKTYTITVSKEEVSLDLKTLKVQGQTLNETFNANTTNYTLEVEYEIEMVTVVAAANDSSATVTTTGGTTLKVGENTVLVTVKDSYGNKKVYTITVTRKEESEDEDSTTTSDSTSSDSTSAAVTDSSSNTGNFKYVLVVIGCIILLAIGGLGIYFYIKTADPDKKRKKLEKKKRKLMEQARELEKEDSPLVEAEPIKELDNEEVEEVLEKEIIDINDQDTLEFEKPNIRPSRMGRYQTNDNVLSDIEDLFEDK